MRRITLWLASTVSALFLLFSYSTSTGAGATTSIVAPQADAAAAAGSDATSGTTSGTSASDATTGNGSASTTGNGSASTTGNSSGSSSAGTSGTGSAASSAAATTVDGSVVSTRYGNVQVLITVAGGKVTAAKVLQVPWSNGKDQQINSRAVPILNSEAVAAQSADIDMVSGATYTSDAYVQSLQAALDAAHV